jgi:hypothetical protein
MRATRWVWILALGVLAVVGGCAPGTAPSDSPPASEGAVGPSASLRAGKPLPLLIDTTRAPTPVASRRTRSAYSGVTGTWFVPSRLTRRTVSPAWMTA